MDCLQRCNALWYSRNSLTVQKNITAFIFWGKGESNEEANKKMKQAERWWTSIILYIVTFQEVFFFIIASVRALDPTDFSSSDNSNWDTPKEPLLRKIYLDITHHLSLRHLFSLTVCFFIHWLFCCCKI